MCSLKNQLASVGLAVNTWLQAMLQFLIAHHSQLVTTALSLSLLQEMDKQPTEFDPVPMDSEDDLFVAYTSGTSGKPRRIVHTQAGYLLYAAFTHKVCSL